MHQKIDINTIMSTNCNPSKTKKKRLYIGQFELLLYIILTSDNILDREPRTVILVIIIIKCMCSRCRRDGIHVCFAYASPQRIPHMYDHKTVSLKYIIFLLREPKGLTPWVDLRHRRTDEHPFGGSNRVLPEWQTQLVCHAAPPGRKNNNELTQCLFWRS